MLTASVKTANTKSLQSKPFLPCVHSPPNRLSFIQHLHYCTATPSNGYSVSLYYYYQIQLSMCKNNFKTAGMAAILLNYGSDPCRDIPDRSIKRILQQLISRRKRSYSSNQNNLNITPLPLSTLKLNKGQQFGFIADDVGVVFLTSYLKNQYHTGMGKMYTGTRPLKP